jgi:hypothetical protein
MTPDLLLSIYLKLDKTDKARLLIELAHNLTVVARDAYFQGSVTNPAKLIAANEFQHRLTRMAADVMDEKSHRTAEETIERIVMGFTELHAARCVERVVARWRHDPSRGSTT